MFTKKVILPVAALAMTALVGCGDDSSSSPASKEAPATLKQFFDTKDVACSATDNMCAKIYIEEDLKDTVQCNGTSWEMMLLGKPVTGCENAAPAAETPADPAAETPADPAAETPADPASETPADPAAETPAAGGATCYMASDVPGMAECIPVTQEQCATIAGEWVEACPVN